MKKINKLFLFLALLIIHKTTYSLNMCGSDLLLQNYISANPNYSKLILQSKYCNFCNNKVALNNLKRINVSIHIIKNSGGSPYPENLSNEDIFNAINHLNESYRNLGLNSSTNGIDTEIEFCVKQISRHTSSWSAGHNISNPSEVSQLKSLAQDDPNSYLNIWVVRDIGNSIAGYATFPWNISIDPQLDGVVIGYEYFDVNNSANNGGGNDILAHEIGHWLGLFHPFQQGKDFTETACTNNNCALNGDLICDTPPENGANSNSCSSRNSCSSDALSGFSSDQNDLIENFMDYSGPSCMSLFTNNQKQAMHKVLTDYRINTFEVQDNSVIINALNVPNPQGISGGFIFSSNNIDYYNLTMYNTLGQLVISSGNISIGYTNGSIIVSPPGYSTLASGTYFYTLKVGNGCTEYKTSGQFGAIAKMANPNLLANSIPISNNSQRTASATDATPDCYKCDPLFFSLLQNDTYNYGLKETEFLGSSLVIDNAGIISVNENVSVRYILPPPLNNTTCSLTVCENNVIDIQNTGLLKIGSNNTNRVGVFILKNNSTINIKNNGKLVINQNSKLIIESGAVLNIQSLGKLTIENGGQVIVNPGAILNLDSGSKLIVQDGGKCIIQSDLSNPNSTINGVLTYNQGAIIQLKGDNAVLEINGRLHIGNNATFGFTYPGSNSGYIKFNRGQGVWWDNWATNNAHITCGTNARINLQGQSKTDKMIDINQINVAIPKNLIQFTMSKCQVEFNEPSARLETDRPTIINNSTFNGVVGGRGLLVFGQPTCIINNCDFLKLGNGVVGALFYSGTKLRGVKGCYFSECGEGIITYGGGVDVLNNNFLNNSEAIASIDITANCLVSNNTIDFNPNNTALVQPEGIVTLGPNVEYEINQNTIHNQVYAVACRNTNAKLRCNDLQNNGVALLSNENSKINMSDLLGGGYNNANNCEFAAKFVEAGSFEADQGFNNFKIANGGACIPYPQSGHGPNITPAYTVCPTIMEGSLINLINFNPTPVSNNYVVYAEQNFWRSLSSATDEVENRQNKIRKIDLTDLNNPIIDSASVITGNVLTSPNLVACPGNGGGTGCVGPACRTTVHPLDDNSNSAIITTASFYNKKLQKALQFSLNKMDKMQNSNKVNQAADLFTECLKYNYSTPVKNSVDKYLLELAYQKLFTCVAQLAEWHRDSAATFNPMPASLQTRFNDLHTICALRAGRKDITEKDYKEVSDLILLDKAMVYRISDNHQNALSIVNNIIAGAPKATHLGMYESFRCMWSTEMDAINGNISVDKALEQLQLCNEKYSTLPKHVTRNGARMINSKQESEVVYASEYAIAVYPNPTIGNLSIAYSLNEFKRITLEIFDAQGKMMNIHNLNPEDKTISIDNLNLENGVYFYNIKGDGKILMSKKLVVVK